MKKITSLLLVLCMVLGMSVSAFAEETNVVTLSPGALPENYQANTIYKLTGEHGAKEIVISPGLENITLDGSQATFTGHIIINIGGPLGGSALIDTERQGSYIISGFNIPSSSLSFSVNSTTITVNNCNVKAMDFNSSNTTVSINGCKIESDGAYPRWDNGNNKNGIYMLAEKYSLTIDNTIVKATEAQAICVQGDYVSYQENKNPQYTNSIVIRNSPITSNYLNIFNDVTYAPVEWPDDYRVTDKMKELAEQILNQNDLTSVPCDADVINVLLRTNVPWSDWNASENDDVFNGITIDLANRDHSNDPIGTHDEYKSSSVAPTPAPDTDDWYEEDEGESLVVRIKFDDVDEDLFDEIKVNLLRNGKKYDSEELSASKNSKKNWRVEWEDLDEDYDWSVDLAAELDGYSADVVNLRGNYWTITLSEVEKAPVAESNKANPDTGASDFVGVAMALAVVSSMGAVALRKHQ